MSCVLVTGGAGFVGSHVADELLLRGHRVVVVDDLSGGFPDNVPSEADFVQGDVAEADIVQRLFADFSFDYVFHLAAYAAEGLSHFIRAFNYRNNVLGSVHLINAAVNAGVQGFVFTSSIAAYGAAAELPMTEETPLHPEDPYGIAKYAVELDLQAAADMFGLRSIVFRPHNVYGSRQNIGDKYRNVIGIFMNQLMQGLPMTVFGDGTQTRAFSHISDVAPVIARSIEFDKAWGETFNVGADTAYSVNELVTALATAMGGEADVRHLPARNEVAHAYASHDKIRRYFGVAEPVDLATGLEEMAVWARQHGARASTQFENIEILRNLPPSWRPDPTVKAE